MGIETNSQPKSCRQRHNLLAIWVLKQSSKGEKGQCRHNLLAIWVLKRHTPVFSTTRHNLLYMGIETLLVNSSNFLTQSTAIWVLKPHTSFLLYILLQDNLLAIWVLKLRQLYRPSSHVWKPIYR